MRVDFCSRARVLILVWVLGLAGAPGPHKFLLGWSELSLVRTQDCSYFASPSGGGDGTSGASPFLVRDFWDVAQSGDTLCLLAGTYLGDASMISPPSRLSGTSSAPISIVAFEDGSVLIDGEFRRRPVYLLDNDHWVLQGFNAARSNATVVEIAGGSDHNVIRRVVAWDAPIDQNVSVVGVHDSHHNLFEDVAAFGTGRKVFSTSQGGNDTVFRRCWGSWDGSINQGPKVTFSLFYNSYRNVMENCIGTWTAQDMPFSYGLVNNGQPYPDPQNQQTYTNHQVENSYGIFSQNSMKWSQDKTTNSAIYGSIAYQLEDQTLRFSKQVFGQAGSSPTFTVDGWRLQDVVSYVPPSERSRIRGFFLNQANGYSPKGFVANNLTSIADMNYFTEDWQVNNLETTTSPQIFADDGVGANLCYRYENGSRTNEPLWPWPMNERIFDAMVLAGRTPVDVTATIERLFGAIPEQCKSISALPPAAPTRLRTVTQ